MKLVSNVTEKNLSTLFSKFDVEKALILEFHIAYVANWYFGWDYVNCKECTTESYSDCTQKKIKNCVLHNI